jgi:hypothetical protein
MLCIAVKFITKTAIKAWGELPMPDWGYHRIYPQCVS